MSGYEALLAIRDAQRLLSSLGNGEAGAAYREFLEAQHNQLVEKHGPPTKGGSNGSEGCGNAGTAVATADKEIEGQGHPGGLVQHRGEVVDDAEQEQVEEGEGGTDCEGDEGQDDNGQAVPEMLKIE